MPRNVPTTLSRRQIASAALDLMDRDGYAAFSMPKLGDALGIRTPSLYHHFADRTEILREVARMVILETRLPSVKPGAAWPDYFVELSANFRRTILRHRNTAPVLVQFLPRDVLSPLYERAAVVLREESPLPTSVHVLVMDGLERITLGTALIEASRGEQARTTPFPNLDPQQHPALTAAEAQNDLDPERLFVDSVRAFLAGIEASALG